MKRNHGPDERKSWGWFIGLFVGFLLMIFGNISGAYTTPPGTAPAMASTPPLSINITSVSSPDHPCLLTSASAIISVNISDIGGTVTKVEFYDGNKLLGTSTTTPYTFTWVSLPKGSHTLTAKAFDNYNSSATSAPVKVTVFSGCSSASILTIAITSPANNALLTPPVTIQASATEAYTPNSSTITKVEFYDGSTLLGHTTSMPYKLSWSNPSSGPHKLIARAYDSKGHKASSSSISIIISEENNTPPVVTPPAKPTSPVKPTPTPKPRPTATPAKGNASCQVSYQMVSQWSGGFSVNLVLTNTGTAPIENWVLSFTFPGDQQITNLWNGNLAQSGQHVTITHASWNAAIASTGSVNLGFNGAWTNNNTSPGAFTINGQPCAAG